jgi:hypothetical protein
MVEKTNRTKLADLADEKKEVLLQLFDGKIDLQTHDKRVDNIDDRIRDILDTVAEAHIPTPKRMAFGWLDRLGLTKYTGLVEEKLYKL